MIFHKIYYLKSPLYIIGIWYFLSPEGLVTSSFVYSLSLSLLLYILWET